MRFVLQWIYSGHPEDQRQHDRQAHDRRGRPRRPRHLVRRPSNHPVHPFSSDSRLVDPAAWLGVRPHTTYTLPPQRRTWLQESARGTDRPAPWTRTGSTLAGPSPISLWRDSHRNTASPARSTDRHPGNMRPPRRHREEKRRSPARGRGYVVDGSDPPASRIAACRPVRPRVGPGRPHSGAFLIRAG